VRSLLSSTLLSALVCVSLLAPSAFAEVVDLTTSGSSGSIGAAQFLQGAASQGGIIEPFLRIERTGIERGLNSDGPYAMNETPGSWTRSIPVASFGTADLNGSSSIPILLDINEEDYRPLLSLDQLMIYTAPVGTYTTLAQLAANGSLLYDLGVGNTVLLNDALEAASGLSDMTLYLPYNLFAPHRNEYLYLYCRFGASGRRYVADGGFEQWSAAGAPPSIGACCAANASCEVATEIDCAAEGGAYLGSMSTCEPDVCRAPAAACCLPDGSCLLLTESECAAQSGTYLGEQGCDPSPCQVVPIQDRSWGQIKSAYHR
jgi:hypothetical protein